MRPDILYEIGRDEQRSDRVRPAWIATRPAVFRCWPSFPPTGREAGGCFTCREISRYHSKLKSSQGGALWGFLRGLDQLFDADKRGLVVKLRDLELVEEFPGSDGRLRFAATKVLLQALRTGEFTGVDRCLAPGFVLTQGTQTIAPLLAILRRANAIRATDTPRRAAVKPASGTE
jgi:hypothetical protein